MAKAADGATRQRPDPAPRTDGTVRWRRVVAVLTAATYLWVVFGLALWVLGPMVGFRWQPIMIDAGSMQPAIHPGDVVLIDTAVDPATLDADTIITFHDPVWPDLLVTHRIVERLDDGTYRTRGDAAAVPDSTPIHPDSIRGAGRLLVPYIGLPMLWLRDAPVAAAIWALITITAWVILARVNELVLPGTGPVTARRRVGRAVLTRLLGGPAVTAGGIRQWAPTVVATGTAAMVVGEVGGLVALWPIVIFLIDPRGPHVPLGRWQRAWAQGRFTRRLKLAPLGGSALSVLMVVVTLASAATFVAASANPTNSFAADVFAAPSGLSATGGGSVSLSWTATPDTYATGHRIFRSSSSGGPYTQIAEVTPRTTVTYNDSPADGTYYYVVQAFMGGWDSPFSNENGATVSTAVPEPTADDRSVGPTGTGSTQQWDHTVGSGNDRILIVTTASNNHNATTVTYGGTPLTLIGRQTDGDNATRLSMWYLVNPPSGLATISVTYAGSSEIKAAGATSWADVDQTTPLGPFTSTSGTGTTASIALTSAPGELVLDAISAETAGGGTAGPGQSTYWMDGSGDTTGGHSGEPGAASVTMSWTLPSSFWAIGAVTLRPAGGGFASFSATRSAGANGKLDSASLTPIGGGHNLRADAAAAFVLMSDAMLDDLGVELAGRVTDSYRTYAAQVDVAKRKGLYSEGGLAAAPGTSNHGLGLAVDLDVSGGVGDWLAEHASAYGFRTIPREPWHWQYGR